MKINEELHVEILERDKSNMLASRMFFMSPLPMAVNRFEDHVFFDVNHRFIRFTGYSRQEIVGRSIVELDILDPGHYDLIFQFLKTQKAIYSEEVRYRTKTGNTRVALYSAELFNVRGKKYILSVYHDINERRHVEDALKQKERELILSMAEIEEAKIALRVLSERRREDRKNLETILRQNIDELVLPYIRELRNCNLNEKYQSYLNILESNLKDIVSPFLIKISSDFKNLTPTEVQVANMVRGGMTSKSIAELLGVAVGTVDTHRNNIRKKLGLKNENVNLRSYLLSIS